VTPAELKALVRTVPDFPAVGIDFRDITTLISHGQGLRAAVGHLAHRSREAGAKLIAGMEARGFIFGAATAVELGVGFLPVRKAGKLPVETIGIDYALEYGADRLEIDPGAVRQGQRAVIVDDLVATGGTPPSPLRSSCVRPAHGSSTRCSSSTCPILAVRRACARPESRSTR
jgi:adenine phosphoribosyltransferase